MESKWCEAGGLNAVSERMHHRMDARALRGKDASKGERPWGDIVCLLCAIHLSELDDGRTRPVLKGNGPS